MSCRGLLGQAESQATTRGRISAYLGQINFGAQGAAAVIGDVQGHSVQAAALLGQIRTAIHSYAKTGAPPEEILTRTMHSFCKGLELDRAAVNAALTLAWSNGRTEGVNTHTKRIMRKMHVRAGFELLRHRILLST